MLIEQDLFPKEMPAGSHFDHVRGTPTGLHTDLHKEYFDVPIVYHDPHYQDLHPQDRQQHQAGDIQEASDLKKEIARELFAYEPVQHAVKAV